MLFLQGWARMHRDMLVHNETNAYLHVSKTWEKVLEVNIDRAK